LFPKNRPLFRGIQEIKYTKHDKFVIIHFINVTF